MDTPGPAPLIGRVNTNDPISSALRRLGRRSSVTDLLRVLGFDEPVWRGHPPGRVPAGARFYGTIPRDTCDAHIYRVERIEAATLRAAAHAALNHSPTRHHVIVLSEHGGRRVAFGCDALLTGLRHAIIDKRNVRPSDLDVLRDMIPAREECGTAHALRILRALDCNRVTDRFFRDVAAMRAALSRYWRGIPDDAARERDALSLLLLSRLIFLCFLQRRRLLANDPSFLVRRLRSWTRGLHSGTFYRQRLRALFFGALNRKPERRSAHALALGELPYLNGGLFEPHPIELAAKSLDLPDKALIILFEELLEKYRFTSGDDDSDAGIGIDPEMLGRIFEGLMPEERRSRTGTFYTPAPLVRHVVNETLVEHLAAHTDLPTDIVRAQITSDDRPPNELLSKAATGLRILDPACGSGAFLLGALAALEKLRPEPDARTAIVAKSLHGVDVLGDAALICSLRLWLSLVPKTRRICDVPPLPNLDRRIRQGDALLDPLDVGATTDLAPPRAVRDALAGIEPVAARYISAGPESKRNLRRQLASLERQLADAWLNAVAHRLTLEKRELDARARDRDLFGDTPPAAAAAMRRRTDVTGRLAEMNDMRSRDASGEGLPFFSFRIHFPDAANGFDVIVCNPPWVRAHRWPAAASRALRQRYAVCRDAGWSYAAQATRAPSATGGQVDLSLLFLERCISLLAPGGTLGMILPAKLLRSLYGAGARALLLREMDIIALEDHSLDHRTHFDADAFTMVLIARRRLPDEQRDPTQPVRVRVTHATSRAIEHVCTPGDLPLIADDPRAPWVIAPPDCTRAFRTMQHRGMPTGHRLTIRRGIMTRANEVLLVRDFQPALGDLASIRTEGYARTGESRFRGWVEASVVRPALRGADIRPWRATPSRHVLWAPVNDAPGAPAPRRLARFLARNRELLMQSSAELGRLHRVSGYLDTYRVAWSDLASELRAAVLPPSCRTAAGIDLPVVPLNTTYFIPLESEREALLLCAYLNSLPMRAFARAIAERAKDTHFRFFAWTIAVLPLPSDWRCGPHADALHEIAASASAAGGTTVTEQNALDGIVAASYGLCDTDVAAIRRFDAWSRGTDVA